MSDFEDFNSKSVSGVVNNAVRRIHSVSRLEVRFEVPGIDSKRVFANGRMQVRVWVFVEAVDINGDPVPLLDYPDLISTRLIHYHNGSQLARGVYSGSPLPRWNSSYTENKYAHEMPGGFQSRSAAAEMSNVSSRPLVFWVSSSEVGQAQIAAEITLQGKVYRSNNTVNPDGNKINKSILVFAERKATFSPDQFSWQPDPVAGGYDGDSLYRYNLGLYPGSRQFKLIHWESSKYNSGGFQYPINFCNTGLINGVSGVRSFIGEFPSTANRRVQIGFPGRRYIVDVHQRSGELSLAQLVSAKYADNYGVRTEPFPFTVIDEYGNDHKLAIRTDVRSATFHLQRG